MPHLSEPRWTCRKGSDLTGKTGPYGLAARASGYPQQKSTAGWQWRPQKTTSHSTNGPPSDSPAHNPTPAPREHAPIRRDLTTCPPAHSPTASSGHYPDAAPMPQPTDSFTGAHATPEGRDRFNSGYLRRFIPLLVFADRGINLLQCQSGSALRIAASINSDTVSPCWMAAIFALRYTSTSSASDVFVRRGLVVFATSEAENVSDTGRMGAAARGRRLRLTGSDLPLT